MKGINTIKLNTKTMKVALQEYFDRLWVKPSVEVTDIIRDYDDKDTFHIIVKEREEAT